MVHTGDTLVVMFKQLQQLQQQLIQPAQLTFVPQQPQQLVQPDQPLFTQTQPVQPMNASVQQQLGSRSNVYTQTDFVTGVTPGSNVQYSSKGQSNYSNGSNTERRWSPGCFFCGDLSHFKRDCVMWQNRNRPVSRRCIVTVRTVHQLL